MNDAFDFTPPDKCTICDGEFSFEDEGGSQGFIGILPVTFCPTCKAGIFDFVESQCEMCQEATSAEDMPPGWPNGLTEEPDAA